MPKKYKFTDETKIVNGCTLRRIQAVSRFTNQASQSIINEGDLGGFIQDEYNLYQPDEWESLEEQSAWVFEDACVYEQGRVLDNAAVCGNAQVYGHAAIRKTARVLWWAQVFDHALVTGSARVGDHAKIYGRASVDDEASLHGSAEIYDNASACLDSRLSGKAKAHGKVRLHGALLSGTADVSGPCGRYLRDHSLKCGTATKLPLVIKTSSYDVIITDDTMKIGCQQRPFAFWEQLEHLDDDWGIDDSDHTTWAVYKPILLELCKLHVAHLNEANLP